MSPIRFGEAFKIQYTRMKGPGKGEQHLPTDPLDRLDAELELEQQAGDRLTLTVNAISNRSAKVILTTHGSYLLTNGPQQNSLSAYNASLASLPFTTTTDEFTLQNQHYIEEQLRQQDILKNTTDLELQYGVGKNSKSKVLYPIIKNMDSILEKLKEEGLI